MKSVAIIVPTIGSKHLNLCIRTIQQQTYSKIKPYYVCDGEQYHQKVIDAGAGHRHLTVLNQNVGAGGWYGHRIYAAFSYLVNEDFVCFLDEDNWLEPDHVEVMVKHITEENLDWTHCLRNIYKKDGTFVCQDNCESLGQYSTWHGQTHHVDTSSFMVRREVLVSVAGAWYGQWGADRQFFSVLREHYRNWRTTRNYSLNYRLDGNPGSVTEDFFINGNKYMEEMYQGSFPWRRNDPK